LVYGAATTAVGHKITVNSWLLAPLSGCYSACFRLAGCLLSRNYWKKIATTGWT